MAFHFLRPEIFWLLPLVGLVFWFYKTQQSSASQWKQTIDAQLLAHLLPDKQNQSRTWLPILAACLLTLLIIAFAGPAWDKQKQPVVKNQDALVIVLDNTLSMLAEDKKPTRSVVAKRKIEDLLKRRTDGLTALVVFSGSAHTVTPLTDDRKTILALLPAIDPKIMPSFGNNVVDGIEQALSLFNQTGTTKGRILLLTDEIKPEQFSIINRLLPDSIDLSIISIGTATGAPIPYDGFLKDPKSGAIILAKVNVKEMAKESRTFGFAFSESTFNDTDLERLGLTRNNQTINQTDNTQSRQSSLWIDQGVWLLWLALPLALLLFRRGWLFMIIPFLYIQESDALDWPSLWQTKDQQAQTLFNEGNVKAAAESFKNDRWKAAAEYKAKDYEKAIETYNALEEKSAEDYYNLGNAYTQAKKYNEAIDAYDDALKKDKENNDAKANRAIAEALKKQQKEQDQKNSDQNQD
jgi:Ca-activated chloride channel family protein